MSQLSNFQACKLPAQDQCDLSFCSHHPKAFKKWIESLPLVNLGRTSKLIYRGVQELSHLKASLNTKLQLLELMRPSVYYTCNALKQRYETQHIMLSPQFRKIANLSLAIRKHLTLGYKVCLAEMLKSKFTHNNKEGIGFCLHRLMTEQIFILLHCYQIYHPAVPQLWYDLNLFYSLAEELNLTNCTQLDLCIDEKQHVMIKTLYKMAVILTSSNPNQLLPAELQTVFTSSTYWGKLISISDKHSRGDLFAIILNKDMAPIYIKDLKENHDQIRYFNMVQLAEYLKKIREQIKEPIEQPVITERGIPAEESYDLLTHLIQAWSNTNKRGNDRIGCAQDTNIVVGFSSSYTYLQQACQLGKGETKALPQEHKNKGCATEQDFHEEVNYSDIKKTVNYEKKTVLLQEYVCQLVNSSRTGYCLSWKNDIPKQLKVGELIAINQSKRRYWQLGTVRWTRHFQGEGIRTGVELLPPNAFPIQAQLADVVEKNEPAEYINVILLSPQKVGGKPSLIVPKLSLRAGDRVILHQNTMGNAQCMNKHQALLEHMVMSTHSFNQFQLKHFDLHQNYHQVESQRKQGKQDNQEGYSEDEFLDEDLDSIWSNL